MPMLEKRTFDDPVEVRPFAAHGHMDLVTVDGFTIGRGVFEPGWKWSVDVKPIAGTESCMARHTGYCLSGSMLVRADDGSEVTIMAGDVISLAPGHDAWTLGDEPCVLLDTAATTYAKPAA